MKITLEQIDLIRKRTNAGYKEAKEALEFADGDIVGALAYLDEKGKAKKTGGSMEGKGIMDKIKSLIQRGNEMKMVVSKEDKVYLRVSINILIILGIIFNFALVGALVLAAVALLMGFKIYFEDHKGSHGIEIIKPNKSPQQPADKPAEETTKDTDFTEI